MASISMILSMPYSSNAENRRRFGINNPQKAILSRRKKKVQVDDEDITPPIVTTKYSMVLTIIG